MFECLFGYPPFSHDDSKQVCHRVVNWLQFLQFPDDVKASTQAKMLILGMLNNRQQRLTIKQIKIHPFFRNFDWTNARKKTAPTIPNIEHEFDTTNFDQFQQDVGWGEATGQRRIHHERARASSADTYKFNYPGFQFKRTGDFDMVDIAKKEIMVLSKEKSCQKSIQSRKSTKRIQTDMSIEREKEKNIFRDNRMRGSVGHGKENKTREITPSMKKTNKLRFMKKKTVKIF